VEEQVKTASFGGGKVLDKLIKWMYNEGNNGKRAIGPKQTIDERKVNGKG